MRQVSKEEFGSDERAVQQDDREASCERAAEVGNKLAGGPGAVWPNFQ
jgi:hypothetical protein